MNDEETDKDVPASRILGWLSANWRRIFIRNFDGLLICLTLLAIGFILNFVENKLLYLNFFFLPTLVAGYLINTRTAVLGALLSIFWVTFFVVLDPEDFYLQGSQAGVFIHLVLWAALLLITGTLAGRTHEELRERFIKMRQTLSELSLLKETLAKTNALLEEKNRALGAMKARVESVLYSTMDPLVAKLIIDKKLRNEKRAITVLFADLADFTSLAEDRPPESVIEDLNRLFSSMEPLILQYRGHLDKYLGDGLMAEFGVPYATQNHSLLAVLAALKMQERMAARDFPWKMRIGIASGPSLLGLLGSEHRQNYTAVGDIVNLASRLQAVCPLGGVCVDEAVSQQVGRWVHMRRIRSGMSPEEAKGLEARLELVAKAIAQAPTAKLCLEAADICSRMGDAARAVAFHKEALELDPAQRQPVEQAIAAVMLTGDDRGFFPIKGKKHGVAAYEAVRLKDPLDDLVRIPPKIGSAYREMVSRVSLPAEHLLPMEAIEGSLGHSTVTAALALCLADSLGLDQAQQRDIFLAAYLHDIGKRNLPEHLLRREDRLEDLPFSDQAQMKSHIAEAQRVISEIGMPVNAEILQGIAQHHERFDGSGYPQGLKGSAIGLPGRIIALADTYEMRTSWRPFSEPWEPRAALTEIARDVREGKFDPGVGEMFLKMLGA